MSPRLQLPQLDVEAADREEPLPVWIELRAHQRAAELHFCAQEDAIVVMKKRRADDMLAVAPELCVGSALPAAERHTDGQGRAEILDVLCQRVTRLLENSRCRDHKRNLGG